MTNEIIIAIVSAVAGGVVTLLTTLALDKRKEKRQKQPTHNRVEVGA